MSGISLLSQGMFRGYLASDHILNDGVEIDRFIRRANVPLQSLSASSPEYRSNIHVTAKAKPSLVYQLQRVRFTFNKHSRNKLLENLASNNNRLRELLESSDRLAATRQHRRKSNAGPKMSSFWQHARNIFCLLKNAWCCECSASHHANVILQAPVSTTDVEMRVSFLFSSDTSIHGAAPWVCQKTTIRVANEHVEPKLTVPPFPIRPRTPLTSTLGSKLRPSLSIRSSAPSSKGGVTWSTAAPSLKLPDVKQDEPLLRIVDLCHTITHSGASPSLGCLTDTDNRYHIYPVTETGSAEPTSESISLERLLDRTSLIRLSRRQRYVIALTIACSHLQLHDSPWLAAQWSKRDILFHCSKDHGIIGEKPYITRSFHSTDEALDGQSAYAVADHGLSTLGILLLELCFGTALEDHEIRKNFVALDGRPNPGMSTAAMMRSLRFSTCPVFAFCIVSRWGKAPSHITGFLQSRVWINGVECMNVSARWQLRNDTYSRSLLYLVVLPTTSYPATSIRPETPPLLLLTFPLALDLVAAMQWCDRYAVDEAGPEFADAINWCLRNPTLRGGGNRGGTDEQQWREDLQEQVIQPLRNCCQVLGDINRPGTRFSR